MAKLLQGSGKVVVEVLFGTKHGTGLPGPVGGENSEPPEDRLRVQAPASLQGQTGKPLFQVLGTLVATRKRSGHSVLSSQPPSLTLTLAWSQRGLSRRGLGEGAEVHQQRRAPREKPCTCRAQGSQEALACLGRGRGLGP